MYIEGQFEFEFDLRVVKADDRAGVNEKYTDQKDRRWIIWETYYSKTHLNSFLLNVNDPFPYLEIFGQKLRYGRPFPPSPSPRSWQIRSVTVLDYLTSVDQWLINMCPNDLRLNKYGTLDCWSARQKRSWKKIWLTICPR